MDKNERLESPQIIQATKAVRYPSGDGNEIYRVYCREDAGGFVVITCCFHEDSIAPDEWVIDTSYTTNDCVEGTDDKAYHCIKDHTSTAEDRPITGENYETYWELDEIEVHCRIIPNTAQYLDECIPELKVGSPLDVFKNEEDEWWTFDWFNGFVECDTEPE